MYEVVKMEKLSQLVVTMSLLIFLFPKSRKATLMSLFPPSHAYATEPHTIKY